MTVIIERTMFAEVWECAAVCHECQRRAKVSRDNNPGSYFT